MPPRKALVIGINYATFPTDASHEVPQRAGIDSLRYAEADANAMGDLLEATGYEVKRLLGVEATYSAIIGTLKHKSMSVGTKGLFVLHFAGHGVVDPEDGNKGYLLPVDADPANLKETAIPLEELTSHYWAFTGKTLTLLDCCHSGYAAGERGHAVPAHYSNAFSEQVKNLLSNVQGRAIFAACADNEKASERLHLGHGAFTYYVLEYWSSRKEVTANNLFDYVDEKLNKEGLPSPVQNSKIIGRLVLRSISETNRANDAIRLELPQYGDLYSRLTSPFYINQLDDICVRMNLGNDSKVLNGRTRKDRARDLILRAAQAGQIEELEHALRGVKGSAADNQMAKAARKLEQIKTRLRTLDREWSILRPRVRETSTALSDAWKEARAQARLFLYSQRFNADTALDIQYAMRESQDLAVNEILQAVNRFISSWNEEERELAEDLGLPVLLLNVMSTPKLTAPESLDRVRQELRYFETRKAKFRVLGSEARGCLDKYFRLAERNIGQNRNYPPTLHRYLLSMRDTLVIISDAYQRLSARLAEATNYKNGLSMWEYGQELQMQYGKLQDEKKGAEKELRQAKTARNSIVQESQAAHEVSAIRFTKRTTARRKT